MGLDRLVHAVHARLRGGVLSHVARLAGRRAGVVERGRLLSHEPGKLQLDLGLSEGVRDSLMGADRRLADDALAGVRSREVERASSRAVADGRAHDPLRVEAVERGLEAARLRADQTLGRYFDVVEEELPLLVRRTQRCWDVLSLEPRRI